MTTTSPSNRLTVYTRALSSYKTMLEHGPKQGKEHNDLCGKVIDLHQRIGADYREFNKQGKLNTLTKKAFASSAREVEKFLGEIGVEIIGKTDSQRDRHLSSSSKGRKPSEKPASIPPKPTLVAPERAKGKSTRSPEKGIDRDPAKARKLTSQKIPQAACSKKGKLDRDVKANWEEIVGLIEYTEGHGGVEKFSNEAVEYYYKEIIERDKAYAGLEDLVERLTIIRQGRGLYNPSRGRGVPPARVRDPRLQDNEKSIASFQREVAAMKARESGDNPASNREFMELYRRVKARSETFRGHETVLADLQAIRRHKRGGPLSVSPSRGRLQPSHKRTLLKATYSQFDRRYRQYRQHDISCPAHVCEFGALALKRARSNGSFWGKDGSLNISQHRLEHTQNQAVHKFQTAFDVYRREGGRGFMGIDDIVRAQYGDSFEVEDSHSVSHWGSFEAMIAQLAEKYVVDSYSPLLVGLADGTFCRGLIIHRNQQGQLEYAISDSHGHEGISRGTYAYFTTDLEAACNTLNRLFDPTRTSFIAYSEKLPGSAPRTGQNNDGTTVVPRQRKFHEAAPQSKASSATKQASGKHFSSRASKQGQRTQPQVAKKWSSNWI